jgi:hypothetical protein
MQLQSIILFWSVPFNWTGSQASWKKCSMFLGSWIFLFQMFLNYIGCKIAEETKQSSNSINRIRRTFRNLKRLKWQITKYDSLKFSLTVRVKNSKCSIFLLCSIFLRVQDPEILLFSRSACWFSSFWTCFWIFNRQITLLFMTRIRSRSSL